MAGKPADEDHPFGHGRIEYIAAFIVAFLVIEVGLTLFKNAAGKIFHPVAMAFKPVSILILVLSICVKLWMGLFNKRLGKRIGSRSSWCCSGNAGSGIWSWLPGCVYLLSGRTCCSSPFAGRGQRHFPPPLASGDAKKEPAAWADSSFGDVLN